MKSLGSMKGFLHKTDPNNKKWELRYFRLNAQEMTLQYGQAENKKPCVFTSPFLLFHVWDVCVL